MKENQKAWMKKNLPLIVVVVFAVVALLYLGDDIVRKRESRISITPVIPVVAQDDPRQGSEDGVQVIEFGDFSCIICKKQVEIIKDVINDYSNNVLIVWKDAPLDPLKPESKNASIAAHCAGAQNKFWEMHDLLYERQDELGPALYTELATELKLNEDDFSQCVTEKTPLEKIEENIQAANDAQIVATPTFYIGGEKYEGLMEYGDFISAFANI